MNYSISDVQQELNNFGHQPPLVVDGVMGPKTEEAIMQFKRQHGLYPSPYIGPITLDALFGDREARVSGILPWVREMTKHMGQHEDYNNLELRRWMASDGQTLGDPAKLPWCGDCMETSIRLSLPKEWPVTDAVLRRNPYWALNWNKFGVKSSEAYGAIATFERPGGGHVALLVGKDTERRAYRVRGGNQLNRVSDSWIAINRLSAIRKPQTWHMHLPKLPEMDAQGQILSKNEA
jgi:hypothetical protein